ncbi:hypothetical protein PENFLA_c005G08201 [Penicillium flavigenum]|uniref:Uncharacterized protein n=1 Tax=Penicillium flavigenum TaxID=254877 RepID=A0A1V6TNJ9_9EURO|nr:hypothetical protein PENFLA_c005G08201 [Penicillium flavigenum]
MTNLDRKLSTGVSCGELAGHVLMPKWSSIGKIQDPRLPLDEDNAAWLSPVKSTVMYQTPLDWPMIYRTGNDVWFADVCERLQEVRARVRHDYAAMQALGLDKGWLKEGDIAEVEESADGSSDSGDVLNRRK